MRNALERNFTFVFFFPAAILCVLLVIYPIFYGIYISFFDTNLIRWNFVGLRNYIGLIDNRAFINSIVVTFKYTAAVVIGLVVLGTFLAVLLNRNIKGRVFIRCILMLPWLIPDVVFAVLFRWMLNPQFGIFNFLLMDIGILDAPVVWLGGLNTALPTVIAISIMRGYPFIMIMVLAALQTVPEEIYEAAEIDGCNRISSFFYITVPYILPVLAVAMILSTVNWFRQYTMIAILTGGGPAGTTSLLSVSIYQTAFDAFRFGEAAAMAVVVFVMCYFFAWMYRRMIDV